jgi:hypothetical protein
MKRQCLKCSAYIPYQKTINGKRHNLKNRKFCLDCSPFKQHNTRNLLEPRRDKWERSARHRMKLKWRLVFYKGGVCKKCGYDKEYYCAYTFHHRNPEEKEFEIANAISRGMGWNRLRKEADKCDLLCVRCHFEIHSLRWLDESIKVREELRRRSSERAVVF